MKLERKLSNNVSWLLWLMIAIVLIQIVVYKIHFRGVLSSQNADWAAFSTYLGLSFSILSVLLVYLTYRSQMRLSAVLQFESVFFQWHEQHRSVYRNLESEIQKFSDQVVLPFIREHKGGFSVDTFLENSDDSNQREVMRYYRSLYHIMKYVHLSPILDGEDKKKKMYIDIIQAQMSDEELNTAFYLLMTDKWKYSKKVLGCSLIEMVDKYHLFKNFYYDQNEKNFQEFAKFMNSQFKKTSSRFQFLGISDD